MGRIEFGRHMAGQWAGDHVTGGDHVTRPVCPGLTQRCTHLLYFFGR